MTRVVEHFESIQGEGPYAGTPSYFIRLSGCILKCPFCDSKFAWSKDAGEPLKDININIPEQYEHIVVSGGEPFIHMGDPEFISLMQKYGKTKRISFETTAIQSLDQFPSSIIITIYKSLRKLKFPVDFKHPAYIISPKLGKESYPKGISENDIFIHYQLEQEYSDITKKNVFYKIIFEESKYSIIKAFINQIPSWFLDNVYIMPMTPIPYNHDEYIKNCKSTVEFCKEIGIRYTPRIHIDIYGVRQGV